MSYIDSLELLLKELTDAVSLADKAIRRANGMLSREKELRRKRTIAKYCRQLPPGQTKEIQP
jgi:hypothetical protein